MQENMQEKRRHKRYGVNELDISGKMMFATEVKILDISIGGVSLKADRRLNIGSEYTLKLEDKDRVTTVRGVVVWSSISGTREGPKGDMIPVYTAGMKFTNILNERITELINFIEDHQKDKHKEHRLSGLRFHIDAPEKAILNFPENYRVKKVSLGGMLIESRQLLNIDSRYPMEIFLPEDTPIRFSGRVASCLLISGDGPAQYDIGIQFIEMSEKDRERFREFIRFLREIEKKSSSM